MQIAIIGSGPTGAYVLSHLIQSPAPLRIVMFEKGEKAGIGMPYSPECASVAMLANIASIEIPPICQTYLDWLKSRSDAQLAHYWMKRDELHDRLFTPRLLLGEYFRDQLIQVTAMAWANGHQVDFREATEVTDIQTDAQAVVLQTASGATEVFDKVVLATGHDFQSRGTSKRGYFPNPWSGLIEEPIGELDVGILGTSLSAIDTVMAVAQQHGRFQRCANGDLTYLTTARSLSITMMSRNGLLPEADFYCPIPYAPLEVLTDEVVAAFTKTARGLESLYDLFTQELSRADPDYAEKLDLAASSADDFADRYFAERLAHDPFDWARRNLAEVEENKAKNLTVAWRYAILRMHEKLQDMLPALSEDDRARFDAGLRRVFIDNYAAVPSESIRRLLALHDAGILNVAALGDEYELTIGNGRSVVREGNQSHCFDVFIDARGQKPLTSIDLPFSTLRAALLKAGQDYPQVDAAYRLIAVLGFEDRIAFGAIPYLMHDKPFVQGITESHEIGSAIARGLLCDIDPGSRRIRRLWA
ncbi:FAD-NAD(P)-binding protein [Pseudorhodobacter turbinis]|uniref:FAD-NAD(P)-binding protein n=1 Tax=Pseudorhodobacter turbinis TaxID=2500533 RepID=A0A4P8ED67_9RHOB|nr:FAD/NAD(P)-binding protein [Pseudorhodobacter turbinis]QCO54716.1 FAD-NAD(P)-binding protein [Pseudorhodobacter turbinis]